MMGVCMRYARNREEAEDMMQEGFIKVFQHITDFKGTGSFEGWIRRIMVNTAINQYHQTIKQQLVHFDDIGKLEDTMDKEEDTADADLDTKKLKPEEVIRLINQMPDGYRMVLNMYVFEGYQHKAIAEALGISENTSKSQLSKGRRYLKQLVSQHIK